MIVALLKSPDRARFDLSSLKNIVYGGGRMYVEQLKEALAAFGCSCTDLRPGRSAGDDHVAAQGRARHG